MFVYKYFFLFILDILIPRFITEAYACTSIEENGEDFLLPALPAHLVNKGEEFEGVVTLKYFSLFGFGLFEKVIGDGRDFVYPARGVECYSRRSQKYIVQYVDEEAKKLTLRLEGSANLQHEVLFEEWFLDYFCLAGEPMDISEGEDTLPPQ